jgi:death on curing protein
MSNFVNHHRDEECFCVARIGDLAGEPLLTGPVEIAAAYLFYLCRNHPFVDGNKRAALATCLVFLSENGLLSHEKLDPDAWESLILDVAATELTGNKPPTG